MPALSIIIPSRNEIFLQQTIDDILAKAEDEIEVIVVLDGYYPDPPLKMDPRIVIVHNSSPKGTRIALNIGVALSKSDYVMKSDAHCMFGSGFDRILMADCQDDWVVTPRRLRLDAQNWCIQESNKPPIDYMYLSAPGYWSKDGNTWTQRIIERLDKPEFLIDETMTMQSSSWLMKKSHYNNSLQGLNEVDYGKYFSVREGEEICLKTWLSGGRVMTNKKTWYAHLHKGEKYGRMYFLDKRQIDRGIVYYNDFWFNNRWTGAKHDLAWLIERFMPVPSWTPELIEQVRKK